MLANDPIFPRWVKRAVGPSHQLRTFSRVRPSWSDQASGTGIVGLRYELLAREQDYDDDKEIGRRQRHTKFITYET